MSIGLVFRFVRRRRSAIIPKSSPSSPHPPLNATTITTTTTKTCTAKSVLLFVYFPLVPWLVLVLFVSRPPDDAPTFLSPFIRPSGPSFPRLANEPRRENDGAAAKLSPVGSSKRVSPHIFSPSFVNRGLWDGAGHRSTRIEGSGGGDGVQCLLLPWCVYVFIIPVEFVCM
ncbi:hypothetical protein E2C01_097645 [Portunus trituberculatus]|uniref:Transmembrane protein n=1 Tax=Portunus trituberculatus TaxID=210409 RepID=A0A5B7K684_PORTR|nr:hypothetical protein [Portunus trituberculatus]